MRIKRSVPTGDLTPPPYIRRPLSNYEGFKRLEASLEKIEKRETAKQQCCDICHRRCRAWRIVPATFGHAIARRLATRMSGGLRGKFVVCCDGPDGCARMLEASGVPKAAIEEQKQIDRLGELGIVVPS